MSLIRCWSCRTTLAVTNLESPNLNTSPTCKNIIIIIWPDQFNILQIFISLRHGNEVLGRELLLNLAVLLATGHGKDERITRLVDTTRIHLMPSMNPDGYEAAKEGDYDGSDGRPNANGFDLNRNFPDQYFTGPHNQDRQPETAAVMNWSLSLPFVLSANLHGGSLVANYPYDDNAKGKSKVYSPSPDDALFIALSKAYSQAHPRMHLGRPCRSGGFFGVLDESFKDGITNGAQWYSVSGGMQVTFHPFYKRSCGGEM